MIKALVFAGNYIQYRQWIHENSLNLKDYIFCSRYEFTLGYHDLPIMLVGTYWENKAYNLCLDEGRITKDKRIL